LDSEVSDISSKKSGGLDMAAKHLASLSPAVLLDIDHVPWQLFYLDR
jgi:hypothetical protein